MEQKIKKSGVKKFFLILSTLILVVIFVSIFLPLHPTSTDEISFLIKRGEGTRDIATHLEKEGFIPSALLFRIFALTTGISGKLQAGTYSFSHSQSPFKIAQKIASGDVAGEYITIIEGWTIKDIASYLAKKEIAKKEEVLAYEDLEGYLFPETYRITADMKLGEIIELMLKTFEKKVSLEWRDDIEKQGKTLSDIVIMASILEKELQTLEDKKMATDVLEKRLAIGMALQVDAAPVTYERRGLPEKPISNPGLESIAAAIYPTKNDYWYYLSTKEGETIFSETLNEHNIAKAKYLR
ncbi:MAG: endolytic transglycosylase MltG [bacterium]|nr:endolytic transglycosylase MltG [bacterium]